MFSPRQSSSRWQVRGAGEAGVGVAVAVGAGAVSATLRKGSRCPARGPAAGVNGSSVTASAVAAAHTTADSVRRKARGRVTNGRWFLLRGEHLPLAVLAYEGDLAGVALVALLAEDFQGGGLPLGLRFLDLELGPLELLLHLLHPVLRAPEAHLRSQHPLVHEGVAVDRLFGGAFDQRLAPALERLLRRREFGSSGRELEGDRADLL